MHKSEIFKDKSQIPNPNIQSFMKSLVCAKKMADKCKIMDQEYTVTKFVVIVCTKGQLIAKFLFGVFNSPKKRMKTIRVDGLEVPQQ